VTYLGRGSFGDSVYFNRESVLNLRPSPSFLVSSLSDLPAPVSGVITLPPDTVWTFLGLVDISPNQIALSERASVLGTVPGSSTLRTNNPGGAIIDTPGVGGRAVEDITIENPAGAGMVFNAGTVRNLLIDTVVVENCASIAFECSSIQGLFIRSLLVENTPQAVRVSGTNGFVRIEDVACAIHGPGFIGIETTPSFQSIEARIEGCTFLLNNPSDVGLDLSATSVDRGMVQSNQFPGVGTPLTGPIDPSNIRWKFADNQGIRDSTVSADFRFTDAVGGPTPIPITTINAWADTSTLTYNLAPNAERVSVVAGNLLQYDGLDPENLRITAQLSAEHAGGGNDRFDITVQRNGVPAVGTTVEDFYQARGELNAGESNQIQTTVTLTNVQPGEQFQILIRNKVATANAEAFSAALTISKG